MLIFWICVVICVGVFAVLIYSIFKHRKSKGAVPATFHESTTVEIIWTTIPFLVLVGMAVPATTTLLALEDTRDPDMSIQVTGYQWKWKYDYLEDDISFFSVLTTPREQITGAAEKGENYLLEVDNPIVVPINKKIRFLITSNDVIHSWWVPALGWKQDAVPGFHQRCLDRAEGAGHLPWQVRRAVRQGPRLHAHCAGRQDGSGLPGLGQRAKGRCRRGSRSGRQDLDPG